MNLLRKHIIAYKTQILETGELPEIYHRKTPEELPESFMVKAEKNLSDGYRYLPSVQR